MLLKKVLPVHILIYMYYIGMLTIKTSSLPYELISSFSRFILLYCIHIKFLIRRYSILTKVFLLHYWRNQREVVFYYAYAASDEK